MNTSDKVIRNTCSVPAPIDGSAAEKWLLSMMDALSDKRSEHMAAVHATLKEQGLSTGGSVSDLALLLVRPASLPSEQINLQNQ